MRFSGRAFCLATVLTACGDDSTGASEESSSEATSVDSTSDADATNTLTNTVTDASVDDSSSGDDPTTTTDATTSTTATSDDTTTGTTETATDTTSGDSSTTDTGVVEGNCYDPATHPWAGALCGSAALPCTILVDEPVDPFSYHRNGSPAVTHDDQCTPHVLYSVAENGYFGHLATRTGVDDWPNVSVPVELALGGVAWDTALDATRVLACDGAFHVTQHVYDGAQWFDLPDIAGQYLLRASGVASLGQGVLHVGVLSSTDTATYARYDGNGWATSPYQSGTRVATAVSPADDAHVTYFATPAVDNWYLMYVAAPDADPEIAVDYGSPSLDIGIQAVATVDTTPHAVLARRSDGDLHEIVHTRRLGPGSWLTAVVIAEDDTNAMLCEYEPMFDGELCEFDYVRYRPLGIATSHGGDVRLFYAEDHYIGSFEATCEMFGCFWQEYSNESVYSTWIAAPNDDGYDRTMLLDRRIEELDLDVDGEGHIHVAAYVEAPGGLVVDYLLLGP